MPHAEVATSEFYKHISDTLPEPRRMRCLLGWCGTRALPPKPDAPKDSKPESSLEFQALQAGSHYILSQNVSNGRTDKNAAARVIQEELSQDLIIRGTLSDWFSRDETEPPVVQLKKKPNPRNITNAAKAEELEKELERYAREYSGRLYTELTLHLQIEEGASGMGRLDEVCRAFIRLSCS